MVEALRLIKNQKGQAMVEFAITMCVFFAILFFFISHAIWLYNSHLTATAARQAAHYYATTDNHSASMGIARNYLEDKLFFPQNYDVTVVNEDGLATSTVQVKMVAIFPGMGRLIDPKNATTENIDITRTATVPLEHKYTNPDEYNEERN